MPSLGTYLVNYNVTDQSGKAAITRTRTVRVLDRTVPELTLLGNPNIVLECSAPYVDAGATAFDICAGDITQQMQVLNSLDTGTPGLYTITYSVQDASGNTAAPVSRSVRVVDRVAPEIAVQGANPFSLSVFTPYSDPGVVATDTCDEALPPVTIDTAGLNINVAGTYTVNYSVSDSSGNTDIDSRTVFVRDDARPVITLNGPASQEVQCGASFQDLGALAIDNYDGDISANIAVTGAVDADTPGQYVLRYDVADAAGNAAVTVLRQVQVVDSAAPEITLLGAVTVRIACQGTFTDPGVVVNDQCEGDLTARVLVTNPVNAGVAGTYFVRYNVTDSAGNAATTVSRTVIVERCQGSCSEECANDTVRADADGDGLTQCIERCLGTSDNNLDSDGDGMPDGYEFNAGLDPTVPNGDADADGDALTNLEEFLLNSSPLDTQSPARTLFVSTNGSDDGDGSIDAPLRTIAAAIAQGNPSLGSPLRVVLASGLYEEDVVLRPGLTLTGEVDGSVRIEGTVLGANSSALEQLELAAFTDDEFLLDMNDVSMRVRMVRFVGDVSIPATGIIVEGLSTGGSVIEDCVFIGLSTGIDVQGGMPLVRRCSFEALSVAGVLVRDGSLLSGSPALGVADDPGTGWNRFDSNITGLSVINLDSETLRAEQNDWSVNGQQAIQQRVDGVVDTDPALSAGDAEGAATVYVVLWNRVNQARISTATVTLEGVPGVLQSNADGVYAYRSVPAGAHQVTAVAFGFEQASATVFAPSGTVTTALIPLTPAQKRAFFGCGAAGSGGPSGTAGDLAALMAVLLVLSGVFSHWGRRSRRRQFTNE